MTLTDRHLTLLDSVFIRDNQNGRWGHLSIQSIHFLPFSLLGVMGVHPAQVTSSSLYIP